VHTKLKKRAFNAQPSFSLRRLEIITQNKYCAVSYHNSRRQRWFWWKPLLEVVERRKI